MTCAKYQQRKNIDDVSLKAWFLNVACLLFIKYHLMIEYVQGSGIKFPELVSCYLL